MRYLLIVLAAWCGWVPNSATAHHLARTDLERRILPPLRVADRLPGQPVWRITSELEPEVDAVGYVFESVDLAPIPGFEGTPINLLIAIDRDGAFTDVEVLNQHEPVFLSGLGEGPLRDFVRQYVGLNLRRPITVSSAYGRVGGGGDGGPVVLDGVTKATASVRIVNRTVLSAALAVARAQLGFGGGKPGGPAARVRDDYFERLSLDRLRQGGHLAGVTVSNREVEEWFAGTEAAGIDPVATERPGETFLELHVAYLNPPTIGRSLLGDEGYARALQGAPAGSHLFWIASAGRYGIVGEDFVRGTTPPRLALKQGGLPLELRDADIELPAPFAVDTARVFAVSDAAGLDPGAPLDFELSVSRAKGQILPRVVSRPLQLHYTPPAALFEHPSRPLPEWLLAWQGRWPDLVVVIAMLLLLTGMLARPAWIASHPTRLRRVRNGYLFLTLVFLGWYAQGQLSIVHVTAAVKSLRAGQGLESFLYDPVSLLIIGYTLITFPIWGRGTFCGWLCPFGALQEFVAVAARRLTLPRLELRAGSHRWLSRLPLTAAIVLTGVAAFRPRMAEQWVEIEPFKTAITLGFERAWPYVAYALLLLAAGAFVYKFFCRYLCPLGAVMRLGGKLRRYDWLARRAECGRPCQTCRHFCAYRAITPEGAVRYDDCFQCLDCVAIYNDDHSCAASLFLARKGTVMVPKDARGISRPSGANGRRSDIGRHAAVGSTSHRGNTLRRKPHSRCPDCT